MATGNWKDVLRAQHDELGRLEEMDAAINEDDLSADIDRILKRQPLSSLSSRIKSGSSIPAIELVDASSEGELPAYNDEEFIVRSASHTPREDDRIRSSRTSTPRGRPSKQSAGSPTDAGQLPPDTQARYLLARNKLLTKQLEDSGELRKQLNEQLGDVQRQLKTEREENKKLNKRIQLLEAENKRSSNKRPTDAGGAGLTAVSTEALQQEVASLRKDLQTAERIAKQADANAKTKDVQLKRATEAIAKLKAQLTEQVQQNQGGSVEDRSRCEAAEARVRTLERQRADLIAAFRKQMKLIDVLKRQKVHIEAARLLAFTEEEFMKALDWTA